MERSFFFIFYFDPVMSREIGEITPWKTEWRITRRDVLRLPPFSSLHIKKYCESKESGKSDPSLTFQTNKAWHQARELGGICDAEENLAIPFQSCVLVMRFNKNISFKHGQHESFLTFGSVHSILFLSFSLKNMNYQCTLPILTYGSQM